MKTKNLILIVFLCCVLIINLISSASSEKLKTTAKFSLSPQIPFSKLVSGTNASGFAKKTFVVVKDNKQWEKTWKQIHQNTVIVPKTPAVDFKKWCLVAVFAGEKKTGGYKIEVASVVRENGRIIVFAKEISPDPSSIVIQVLSYPYTIVKINATNLPMVVKYK